MMFISIFQSRDERDWFASKMEECRSWTLCEEKQKDLGLELLKSQVS